MESINELIELIKLYIVHSMEKKDIIERLVVPLAPIVLSIIGGLWALKKHLKVKNRELNEKILNEVYSPLYRYLVKQELCRKIYKVETSCKEAPILEFTSSITGTLHGLSRDEFIKVKNSVNLGLASQEMLTLITMYEITIEIEDKGYRGDDIYSNAYLEATILKVKIENAFRKEIILGYNKYHKALGLKRMSKSGLWKLKKNNIEYKYEINESEKEELRRDIKANSDKYE